MEGEARDVREAIEAKAGLADALLSGGVNGLSHAPVRMADPCLPAPGGHGIRQPQSLPAPGRLL
jgi:hypothetical protein